MNKASHVRRAAMFAFTCIVAFGLAIIVAKIIVISSVATQEREAAILGVLIPTFQAINAIVSWGIRQMKESKPSIDPFPMGDLSHAAETLARQTKSFWNEQTLTRWLRQPACVRWRTVTTAPQVQLPSTGPQVTDSGKVTSLRKDRYEKLGPQQKLILLGRPGAGKTAAMLLLLVNILENRRVDSKDPIPVWLTLGNWNPSKQPFDHWATVAINRNYPALSRSSMYGDGVVSRLLRDGRIALFLDGLDEIPAQLQASALEAINTAPFRIVLTCRSAEYEEVASRGHLADASVLELIPLIVEDTQRFLEDRGLLAVGQKWTRLINHLKFFPDSPVRKALGSPLALSLALNVYRHDRDPMELADSSRWPDPESILNHLFDGFFDHAYTDEKERTHAKYWLGWIATNMRESRDLGWWDISDWVPAWQLRLMLALPSGISVGLAAGIFNGVADSFVFGIERGIRNGLTSLFTLGLAFAFLATRRITQSRELRSSHSPSLTNESNIRFILILSMLFSLLGGVNSVLRMIPPARVPFAMIVGGLIGAAVGVSVVGMQLWNEQGVPGWRTSRLLFGLSTCGGCGYIYGLAIGLNESIFTGLISGVPYAVFGAILGGIIGNSAIRFSRNPQSIVPRLPTIRELRRLLISVLIGSLIFGLPIGRVFTFGDIFTSGIGLSRGLLGGMLGGALLGLMFGLLEIWAVHSTESPAATPHWIYKNDQLTTRWISAGLGTVFGISSGLAVGLGVTDLDGCNAVCGMALGASAMIIIGCAGVIAGALVFSAQHVPVLQFCEYILTWRTGKISRNIHFMKLLTRAHEIQVFRQVGAVYQFRHAGLQDYLVREYDAMKNLSSNSTPVSRNLLKLPEEPVEENSILAD